MRPRSMVFLALALLLSASLLSCNIFSPFAPKNDSPQTLLEQGKSALQNGDNDKALDYLARAMEAQPDNFEIRYYHAVAVVRVNGIDFQDFIDAFQQEAGSGFSGASGGARLYAPLFAASGIDTLFRLPEGDLRRIISAFWVVKDDLAPLVEALQNGTLDPNTLPFTDDVLLSSAVANLVSGLIFLLDDDGAGPEFQLDTRVILQKSGEAYALFIQGEPKAAFATIEDEIVWRIQRQWNEIRNGLAHFYLYYEWTQFQRIPASVPLPPQPVPTDLNDSIAGQLLEMAYNGIYSLWNYLVQHS